VSPTPAAVLLLVAASLSALIVPPPVAAVVAVAVLVAAAADAWAVRAAPTVTTTVPHVLSRGIATPVTVAVADGRPGDRVRQATSADVRLDPAQGTSRIDGALTPVRRGRHLMPPAAVRRAGPLGLGTWTHQAVGEGAEVLVYPDLVTARRIALAVRTGRFRHEGRLRRGPLGLGTEFESIRDYLPDDDVRQVNWRATARLGRPMSNQFRVERDRDVLCLIDLGRLMGAPLDDRTRLDAAVDAVTAVALVADEVGDRCGVIAFDDRVRRNLRPRRAGGEGVIRAIFDLEPTRVDSDYELAFRTIGSAKRAFVLVLTDLLDASAARPLSDAIGVVARRHEVVVAGAEDPDITGAVRTPPTRPADVYAAAVAVDVLAARARAAAAITRGGALVVEAPPATLGEVCVRAYLRAKALARL